MGRDEQPFSTASDRPDCRRCKHFAVSWYPREPYLCRLLGFRSLALPCLEVMRCDGRPCTGFQPKPVNTEPAKPKRAGGIVDVRS